MPILPASCPHCGQDMPAALDSQPSDPLTLDANRTDEATGLEVWTDPSGKVRRRVDGLWDAAALIWGTPRTDRERGRRNRHIKELRDAGVHPDMLMPLFQKAVVMWGGTRPGLNGIIVNLGDLIEGVSVSPDEVAMYLSDQGREARRSSLLRAVNDPV